MTIGTRCLLEVRDLHEFFEKWLGGQVPDSDQTFERFSVVMAPGFEMVPPTGKVITLNSLATALKQAHGALVSSRPPLKIEIHDARVVWSADTACLVAYEERQIVNAKTDRRISSALFREKSGTPHGVEWLFLHEVWLERGDPAFG